jgi:hypothetical protein
MFAELLSGFRQATARPHRTKDDWAHEVAQLLDARYANTPRITLVCDNLNTHTVLVHREMEFPPVGATTSCPGCRGIVPRRFVASVPIPERLMSSV